MTTYTVRTPTTTVAVSSPTTRTVVSTVGLTGRSGPALPLVFYRAGAALPLVGKARYRFPFAATLTGVSAAMSAPPTGSDLVATILVNGTGAATVTVPDGQEYADEEAISVPVSVGDYVTVDIESVGSTTNGNDLSVFIRYTV